MINRLSQLVKLCMTVAVVAMMFGVYASNSYGQETTAQPAAWTFKLLYAFTGGSDGGNPVAGLIQDAAGNLYGTSVLGGGGYGTVFKLNKTGKETVLHTFTKGDGGWPYSGLARSATGNLYGTTEVGGTYDAGTVFMLDKTGKETVLYAFTGTGGDGFYPFAGLLRAANGDLYGTTYEGGSSDAGTVFKVDSAGEETVLHSFDYSDGANPRAGLVPDAKGNLYGTTSSGGTSNSGTVFMLHKAGKETLLYSFSGGADGGIPIYGYLVRDARGNLYGTTYEGGAFGYGTVFMLDKSGNETVLHSFGSSTDGANPDADLVLDPKGNLYGTTESGGASGEGTVFKLGKSGKETVLHRFAGSDGAYPVAGLARDAKGNLYGTAYSGGTYGAGTVWELIP
jgi:uncharacterized repeat protein (TIGR03803 family)